MKISIKKFVVKNIKWVILFICLICFLLIAENVFNKEIMKIDIKGYELVSKYLISDFATPIAKFITNFGGAICLITISIMLFIFIKNKKIGTSIIINLGIATILNIILKWILQRQRPMEYRIINESRIQFSVRTFYGRYGFLWLFNIFDL